MPPDEEQHSTLHESLKSKWQNWKDSGAPPQVLDYIQFGHKLPWIKRPNRFHHGMFKTNPQQRSAWLDLKAKYLQNGAIKQSDCTGFTSRAFLVPKKFGGWRLCVDLRYINEHVRKYVCRFESLKALQSLAQKGYFMVSFDLQDAYQCVSIVEEDQKYLSFCVDGEYFVCTALPFGYTNSPYVFTKVARHFSKLIRAFDGQVPEEGEVQDLEDVDPPFLLSYLDDFMVAARSAAACCTSVVRVNKVCQFLGLRLNLAKCHLEPTQVLEHLGMVVDFARGVFDLSATRKSKVQQSAKALMMNAARNKRVVSVKAIQTFTGLAQSCKLAVPLADHYLRALYTDQSKMFKPGWAKLSHQAMHDLRFWITLAPHNVGAPIWKPPADVQIFTDASSYACGAILPDGSQLSIPWSGPELQLHINLQELLAVIKVFQFCPELQHCVVKLCIDNMCVLHWLSGMKARCASAQSLLHQLVLLLQERSCVLQPVWIPSELNPADAPSRECLVQTPISVSRRGREMLQRWLNLSLAGWSVLDQPTRQAAAKVFCPQGPPVLVLLPTGSLHKVLLQLALFNQSALILAPLWEAQLWFPGLAGQSHWVAHVPWRLRHQFCNLPPAWDRSRLALWGVRL